MMIKNILSIDTVFGACAVGVIADDNVASRTIAMQRGQSEQLMPMILDVVAESGITLQNLDLIVVNVGPGSFTGVRIGIATARGIALGLNIPVQGVCAMDALADMASINGKRRDDKEMRVAINSQRGDYFIGDYAAGMMPPIDPDGIKIMSDITGGAVLVVGTEIIFEPGLAELDVGTAVPYPIVLARLGLRLYAMAGFLSHGKADPLYLRDAEISIPKKNF